jgi:hypothetical protein
VPLAEASGLTEASYAWEATSVPDGLHRLRVEASDRPSNRPDEARAATLESAPFVVDHKAPAVSVEPLADRLGARARLRDDRTRIASAEYALDGGDFAEDDLFDTLSEAVRVDFPSLAPGPHVLMIRARDAAGNLGAGDVVIGVD